MIVDPANDRECLGQLTRMSRELSATWLVELVARRLSSPSAVVRWIRSLPQTDDDGDELVQFISCDVPQRVRLFPPDPNCFERAFAAMVLLEVLAPKSPRMFVTVDKPARHTGLVERRGRRWVVIDLFPTRNASAGAIASQVLHGTHQYVGKPILKFYLGDTGGKLADALGEQEDRLGGGAKNGREKKSGPRPSAAPRIEAAQKGGANAEGEGEARTDVAAAAARTGTADGHPAGGQARPSASSEFWGWG